MKKRRNKEKGKRKRGDRRGKWNIKESRMRKGNSKIEKIIRRKV